MYSLKLYTQQEINYFSLVPIRNNIDVNRHFEVNLMTKSKFQLVGSLLRPADLRKYKDEIEHRDDIQYPFYDALGNVTSMTDGEGNTTRYAYTLSGQLAKVTDALGNETEYQYDVCDRLIEIRQYGAEGSLKENTEGSGMDADLLEAESRSCINIWDELDCSNHLAN